MAPSVIHIVNRSTLVADRDVATMTAAISHQVAAHLAPAWGVAAPSVVFDAHVADKDVAKLGHVITMLDTLDEADALGWHTDDGADHIYGECGVKAVLDQGAKALVGAYAVSTILSHEVAEMVCDPFCASWSDSGRGYLVATEVCDPVQSDYYLLDGVAVSNFVTPAWFDPHAVTGPFDYMAKVRKPFTLTRGGYWVQLAGGRTSQKFGEHFPMWLREAKSHPRTRTQRIQAGPGDAG